MKIHFSSLTHLYFLSRTISNSVARRGQVFAALALLLVGLTQTASAQSFAPPVIYPTGNGTNALVLGDFNGDNKTDAVVTNRFDKTISILLGNGDGTFKAKVDYPVGTEPWAATTGDYNGDGKLDVATANYAFPTSNISVLFGNGDGTFGTKTDYAIGGPVQRDSIGTGDFNGDGKPDLVSTSQSNNTSILLNTGNGTFGTSINLNIGSFPNALIVGEFNNDNKPDLAILSFRLSEMYILLGKGDGTFNPLVRYATGLFPYNAAVGDFNRDSKPDLITSNLFSNSISVLLGNGDGTFQPRTDYPTSAGPIGAAVGPTGAAVSDYDGDGKLDVALGNSLTILRGNGDGTFQSPLTYEAPGNLAAAGDFNQDGKPDLATAGGSSLNVLLNQSGAYSISGIATDQNNAPLGAVRMTLAGSTPVTVNTASDGSYSFKGLASGVTYTVAPFKSHYNFSPTGQTFTNLSDNKVANFTGTLQTHALGGVVRDNNNVGMSGVTIMLGGTISTTTMTASDGSYSFPSLPSGGNYTITPSFANYTFSPPTRAFNNLSANNTANFTGAPVTYRISGVVRDASNSSGLPGMTVSLSGSASAVTVVSPEGAYSFAGLTQGGTYTVTVSSFTPGALFTKFKLNPPLSQTFFNLSGDATADFTVNVLSYAVGNFPSDVVIGDFNADGKRDLAVGDGIDNFIRVLLGNGDGTFQNAVKYNAGSIPVNLTTGDFNGDGKLDLVAVSGAASGVNVLLGNGNGTFQTAVSYPAGSSLTAITTADFNGDSKLDLAVASRSGNDGNNVRVLFGNGDGTFQTAVPYATGMDLFAINTGDFNSDGKPDLVYVRPAGAHVLINNGNGTFGNPVAYAAGLTPSNLAVADVNSDGKLDLILANYDSDNVSILLGSGSGTFATAVNYASGRGTRDVAVSDFNGDGKVDLAALNLVSRTFAILPGNGDGTFQSPVPVSLGNGPFSIAAGDFNNDGKPDVAPANVAGGLGITSVSVFLNIISNAAPANITGNITTANGTPVSGVRVTLVGSQNLTALTDVNGNYAFPNLAAGGTYAVTPTHTFYRFAPRGQTVNNLNGNQRVDFVATPLSFSLAGRVTDAEGNAISGVTVSLSGSQSATAITNATGTYSFLNLAPTGNYTVMASLLPHTFTPANRTITNLSAHTVADFMALPATTLQLSASNYVIGEAGGSTQIRVSRADNSLAATVDYATSDTSGLNDCSSVTGLASSRCDYATTVGTLRFAAGESSKTIYIPIIDDNIADGNETFTLTLSNPSGASLGTNTSATITITDNANTTGNPIDKAVFFVRQHYIDFLGREPEAGGLSDWVNIYNNCGTTVTQNCGRIEISSAFFRSPEFQDRAYFIYRFYSMVGKIPLYENFMPDFAKVSGFLSTEQLDENKLAFIDEFMARSDFQTKYGALTDPTSYVDALLQTVALPNHPSRQAWITGLTNGSLTRAQVLRALVESTEVYDKYYNEAFVIMQYFGYLRRSADISYLNWIQTMNTNGGNYRIMIDGFLNSAEYRNRFQ